MLETQHAKRDMLMQRLHPQLPQAQPRLPCPEASLTFILWTAARGGLAVDKAPETTLQPTTRCSLGSLWMTAKQNVPTRPAVLALSTARVGGARFGLALMGSGLPFP